MSPHFVAMLPRRYLLIVIVLLPLFIGGAIVAAADERALLSDSKISSKDVENGVQRFESFAGYSAAALLKEPASVDFERQVVKVWGLAGQPWSVEPISYEDERARAWMHALHLAYEAILQLPLMEGLSVKQALQTNAALKERLGMVLLSAPRVFYEPDQSGLIRCRLEIPFSGAVSLRSALYLAALRPRSLEPLPLLASWSVIATATPLPDIASGPAITRLILDLRRSWFEPSLFPRFFSEQGYLLFQEAQVPTPERFSRPAVLFTTDIKKATAGKNPDEIAYIDAHVPPLSHRDIKIAAAEESLFVAFCRRLVAEPLGKRDIMIVYTPRTISKQQLVASSSSSIEGFQSKKFEGGVLKGTEETESTKTTAKAKTSTITNSAVSRHTGRKRSSRR